MGRRCMNYRSQSVVVFVVVLMVLEVGSFTTFPLPAPTTSPPSTIAQSRVDARSFVVLLENHAPLPSLPLAPTAMQIGTGGVGGGVWGRDLVTDFSNRYCTMFGFRAACHGAAWGLGAGRCAID